MDEVYVGMGRRVFELRIMKEISRENLAIMSGLSTKFLYEIEMEKKGFSVKVLCKLCKALDVEADYILYGRNRSDFDLAIMRTLRLYPVEKLRDLNYVLKYIYKIM